MKFLTILCTFFSLAVTQAVAQNEYFWTIASNATGVAVAAWADNQNQDVRVSIYSLGSWSTVEVIPGSENTGPWPILIEMDAAGNIVMVWGNTSDGTIMSSVKKVLLPWTEAAVISSAINFSSEPLLTLDIGGNATVVWLDYTDGLQASKLAAATTVWSEPETLPN